MSTIQAKQVLKYAVMPEVIPRLRRLFGSGFGYFAFLMAQVYGMVRLLPYNHPYLNPQNIGRFGIRHVIAEAANHIVLKKENIDQLIIFVVLLLGVLLLGLQLLFLAYNVLVQPAMATQLINTTSLFITERPQFDIAFMLLDQVFGVPNLYNSCIATATPCPDQLVAPQVFPWPFHLALQDMFQFYSTGLLLVGLLIFLYFVVVVTAETAVTGTPFGQRFQNIWVPVRLVVAIGLLIPLNFGFNSAQYITLFAAKLGSSFATNSWLLFNSTLADSAVFTGGGQNPTGERNRLIALPKSSDAALLAEAMSIIHACAVGYWVQSSDVETEDPLPPSLDFKIRPYFVKTPADWMENQEERLPVTPGTTYQQALDFFNDSDIVFRFGIFDPQEHSNDKGQVEPTCGEIRVPITDVSSIGEGAAVGGTDSMQQFYYNAVINIWFNDVRYQDFAQRFVIKSLSNDLDELHPCDFGCDNNTLPDCGDRERCASTDITAAWKQDVIDDLQANIDDAVFIAWALYNENGTDIEIEEEILDRGWGGAGIWFNRVARLNGAFTDAVRAIPTIESYPKVMEDIREERRINDPNITGILPWLPYLSDGEAVEIEDGALGVSLGTTLNDVIQYWDKDVKNQNGEDTYLTGGMLQDAMNLIFGTDGLFDMTQDNAHIHPLAQLTTLGKGLVDSSVRNVAVGSLTAALGGPTKVIDGVPGALAEAASEFLTATAFIGLTAGIVLYYVLPFLPFLYFYFAVAEWVKSIFEAMVGAPLWALAHLRLDGHGLPGDAASGGYFLIFEIFIRPILTVFGLVAALIIFTAQVRVLNFIWQLVTDNLGGFNVDPVITTPNRVGGSLTFNRGIVDQFFFTVLYAIIVYLMATSAFKLINRIPDNLLRWMGANVSSFGDINQDDPTAGLSRYASLAGASIGPQVSKGVREFAKGSGDAFGGSLQRLATNIKPGPRPGPGPGPGPGP